MLDLFGWIGNLFFIFGAIFIAKKSIAGLYCQIFGNVSYVFFSILIGNGGLSLGALSVILILINIYGLFKWSKTHE